MSISNPSPSRFASAAATSIIRFTPTDMFGDITTGITFAHSAISAFASGENPVLPPTSPTFAAAHSFCHVRTGINGNNKETGK